MKAFRGIRALVLLSWMVAWCAPCPGEDDPYFGARFVEGRLEPDPEAIGKLLVLRGEKFAKALRNFDIVNELLEERGWPRPFSDVDLIAVLERAVADDGEKPQPAREFTTDDYSHHQMLTRLIKQADPALLDRLALLVAAMPKRSSSFWPWHFEAIVRRLLEREFTALQQEGAVPLKIEWKAVPAPDEAPEVSPALRTAWERFVTVGVADRPARDGHEPGIGFSTNISGYLALLDELLRGGAEGIPEKIATYFHDGGCIGDPLFFQTAAPARWLALVRQRRLPDALRESFAVGDFSSGENSTLRRRLLTLCGLDAAELEAGWWLARFSIWHKGSISFSDGRGEPEEVLDRLALGSEQQAGWVLELARLAAGEKDASRFMNQRKSFIDALGLIIERGPRDPAILGPFRHDAPPLPGELRHEAALELVALVDAGLRTQHVQAVIEKVRSLGLREAIPRLQGLVAKPPAEIQRAAAAALRDLGEAVEDPVLREPVRFRLVSGGRPLARLSLSVEFPDAEKPVLNAAGESMYGFATDDDGVIKFPWEDYRLVAGAGARMVLQEHNSDVPHPGDLDDTRPRFFEVEVALPAEPPEESVIEIPSQRLTVRLKYARPRSFLDGRRIDLRMTQRKKGTPPSRCVLGDWKIPAVAELTTWVQPGSYDIAVLAPGHVPVEVDAIKIRAGPVTVPVKLAPGTDVQFEFVDLAGAPYAPSPSLSPNRKNDIAIISRRSDSQRNLLGLPPGEYSLSVPSSDDWHALVNRGRPLHENAPRHAAKVVKFRIPADPPPELDLGQIVVPQFNK